MAVVRMDLYVFAERAVLGRATGSRAEVAHLWADVVAALTAVGASTTWVRRVNSYSAARRQYICESPRINDLPGRLMPENKGTLWDEIAVSAVYIVMQVRATDTSSANLYQDLVRGDLRPVDFRGSQVASAV